MEKVYTSPTKNYIQRNGFVMISNLLLDFQEELNLSDSEIVFISKIMRNKDGYIIHDKDLDKTVSSKTLSRRRASLKEKGYLNFSVVKKQNELGNFLTGGISYDLSGLEAKLQEVSDRIEKSKQKDVMKEIVEEKLIIEPGEESAIEKFTNDYKNYYNEEYKLTNFEIETYNSLSKDEKQSIGYIFDYCEEEGVLGKIVPRLTLFFKTKFRFVGLMNYYYKNKDNVSFPDLTDLAIELATKFGVLGDYAAEQAIKRSVDRYWNGTEVPANCIKFIEKLIREKYLGR